MITVRFQDNGQDFLEWDIDPKSRKIVGCRPFQGSVWGGALVLTPLNDLRSGALITIQIGLDLFTVRYPLRNVARRSSKAHNAYLKRRAAQ